MPWYDIIYFIIALIIMIVGLAGVILPVLPGIPLMFGAAFLFALLTGFDYIGWDTLLIYGILTAFALLIDWLASVFGVKKMGGTNAGMIGAFIGMIVGLLIPGPGIFAFLIFSFLGAFFFELLFNRDAQIALRAGLGSFLGFLAGGILKFAIGMVIIGNFIWRILF
ncbi:MAG: DUF456 family protein [candidate division Zixibacteria bacterium]|nr:DUF456 family protein [candidate division Zixibacteria bacterium]